MQLERRKYDNLSVEEKLDLVIDKLERLEEAFPFGLEHHKAMHENLEEAKREEQAFIRDIKLTLVKNGIIGVILFILSATLIGIASKWSGFVKGLP